jgi:hypothetical protein
VPTWAPAGVPVAVSSLSLTATVDDCAYACLQGGYSILSSATAAAVQLLPVTAMPYPSCTCPTLSAPGMSAAGAISGTFAGAQGSYSFTAAVEAANRVTLSLMTAAGAALGAVTYDAAGCVPSTVAFCGISAAGGSASGGGLPGASATPSPGAAAGSGGGGSAGSSGISGGAVAGIVIGLLLAAAAVVGAVFLYKRRAGAGRPGGGKRSSAASQARVKQLEATNVANPMRTSNTGGGGASAKASFAAQPRGAAV